MNNMNPDTIRKSELIINEDGSAFHLHILPEDIADTIVIVGDPGRVDMVADHFDSREFVKQSREFRTITGSYGGKRVTALSHGIGTDNIDIVLTELDALANIDFSSRQIRSEHRSLRILRIGTCGAIQPDIALGSYIFSEISIGFDGVLNWYKEGEKYMLKEYEEAFVKYMNWPERFSRPYFVKGDDALRRRFEGWTIMGMTVSAPGFYGPQGRSIRMELTIPDLIEKLGDFRFAGHRITNIEMESSALSGMASVLGHKVGTVCLAAANRHVGDSNPDYKKLMDDLVERSLSALIF